MDDLISRQEAIDAICKTCYLLDYHECSGYPEDSTWCDELVALRKLPSAQAELYGYKIEHLALISRVMQREGVSPEKAVETFANICGIVQMIFDEQKEIIKKAVKEWT